MEMGGVDYAGEFDILELKLILPTGQILNLDKDFILTEINIFENIFTHSIMGNIIVGDTRELITKGAFIGQEKLSMKIQTPSPDFRTKFDDNTSKDIDFTDIPLRVHKIPIRTSISSGAQFYEFQFISDHAVVNATKRISKSYVKTKSNIGEMVEDLLVTELGIPSEKVVENIEGTIGSRPLLIQNSNPLAFISRLTKEAISEENGSSEYVFFANKNGLHFRTLQSLFEREPRGLFHNGDQGFDEKYDNEEDSGKITQHFRRILDFELVQGSDFLHNNHKGMIGGKVVEHNLFRKKLETKTFNYFDDESYKGGERINEERLYVRESLDASDDELTNSNISVIANSKDKSDKDMFFELKKDANQRDKTILRRQSKFSEIHDGISIKMEVTGYTALTAGDMVFVNLQSIGGDDSDPALNKFYSGPYLVKTLRHKFSYPTRTHTMSMTVVKDGLPFALEPDTEAFQPITA